MMSTLLKNVVLCPLLMLQSCRPAPVVRSRASSVSSNCGQVPLTDHRVVQRQKQIEFGKNTLGYQRYVQTIPKYV